MEGFYTRRDRVEWWVDSKSNPTQPMNTPSEYYKFKFSQFQNMKINYAYKIYSSLPSYNIICISAQPKAITLRILAYYYKSRLENNCPTQSNMTQNGQIQKVKW